MLVISKFSKKILPAVDSSWDWEVVDKVIFEDNLIVVSGIIVRPSFVV